MKRMPFRAVLLAVLLPFAMPAAAEQMAKGELYSMLARQAEGTCKRIRGEAATNRMAPGTVEQVCCMPAELEKLRTKLGPAEQNRKIDVDGQVVGEVYMSAHAQCRLVGATAAKQALLASCEQHDLAKAAPDPAAFCTCFRGEIAKVSPETIADISEGMQAIASEGPLTEESRARLVALVAPLRPACK